MKKITTTLFFCFLFYSSFSQWNTQTIGTNAFYSVYFTSTTNGCAVDAAGGIYKTSDGGVNWALQTTASGPLYSLSFGNSNKGSAVGAGGIVMTTADGGTTWTPNTSSQGNGLASVFFVDADTGYAVGNNGIIIKTTNAGNLWQSKNSNTSNALSGVFFTDVNTGYAVGSYVILKTTDRGTTWTSQPSAILTSVYFTDANTGYATGYSGTILKTLNAGLTWTSLTSGTSNDLYSIRFAGATTGFAVGASGTILKTTDAGATWAIQNSGTSNTLNSVFFTDPNNGYAVGSSGTIINTTDGGCSTPAAPTASGQTICNGNVATLTATAPGGTYEWYDAATGGTLLITGSSYTSPALAATATYYVQTTGAGCTSPRTSVTVTVNPAPAAPTAAGTIVCSGNAATLTATAPGGTYQWYDAATGGTLLSANASYTGPALTATTTYYVQTTVIGCTSPRTAVTVTVNPAPTAPATSSNSPVCSGTNMSLTASTIVGAAYFWTGPNAYTSTAQNPTIIGASAAASGVYYVTATLGGCTSAASTISVIVNPLPAFTSANTATICSGASVNIPLTSTITSTYTWIASDNANTTGESTTMQSTGTLNNTITNSTSLAQNITYTVTATSLSGGCTMAQGVTVTINPTPTAPTATSPSLYCIGDIIADLTATGIGTLSWYSDPGLTTQVGTGSPFASGATSTSTFYVLETLNGCQSTATAVSIVVNPSTAIYGHVSYSLSDVNSGKIIIYLENGLLFDSVQVATLGANGIFLTPPLNPGNYLLKAFADTSYHTLTPTYNGNVWDWNVATVIVHDCSMIDTANITMVEETVIPVGPGAIGGLIEEGVGFIRLEGDPIPGLDVKLGKNPGGQIVASTQTDGNGYYHFSNLALNTIIGGSYNILADIPGIGMASSYNVILNPSNSSYDSLNYIVNSTTIDTVVNSLATGISNSVLAKENKFTVYPNPFKGNTSIEYFIPTEADVRLDVFNVLGVKINSLVNSKQSAGNHKCNLNNQIVQLSSGVYFVKLTINGKSCSMRIVVLE